jgi:hypothetical protein
VVNNATNINTTKEILNIGGQQCHKYQTLVVNNATNIKHWWSTMPQISNIGGQQCHKYQTLVINNATNINKPNNHFSRQIIYNVDRYRNST